MIRTVHLALRGVLPSEELSVELKLLISCVRDAVRAGEDEELPPADLVELVAVGCVDFSISLHGEGEMAALCCAKKVWK